MHKYWGHVTAESREVEFVANTIKEAMAWLEAVVLSYIRGGASPRCITANLFVNSDCTPLMGYAIAESEIHRCRCGDDAVWSEDHEDWICARCVKRYYYDATNERG